MQCQYCSAFATLSVREVAPRAGLRSSLAEETARLSRLKAQLEHPVTGHPYDLTRTPADLTSISWTAEAALQVWTEALAESPSGVEAERRVCWIALKLGERATSAQELRLRTLLESSLGWLRDDGYRHLIRCRLAQLALQAGELDAAEGWLNECDWAPEVLELDSPLRLVRAHLALRRERPTEVLELLGEERDTIPIAKTDADQAARLRIDALERLGRKEPAYVGFLALARSNGLEKELARFERHELAPRTRRLVEQDWRKEEAAAETHRLALAEEKRCKQRQARYENAKKECASIARSSTGTLRWLPVGAFILSASIFLFRSCTDLDPLGGIYGFWLCPRVCAECEGPTRIYTEWTRTGPGESSTSGPEYFCRTPRNGLATLSKERLQAERHRLREYQLGGFSAFMATFLLVLLLMLPAASLMTFMKAKGHSSSFWELSHLVEKLASELEKPPPLPDLQLKASLRSAVLAVIGSGLLAALLAHLTA